MRCFGSGSSPEYRSRSSDCFPGKRIFTRPNPLHLVACAILLGGLVAGHGRWLHFITDASSQPHHTCRSWGNTSSLAGSAGRTRCLSRRKDGIAGVFLTNRDFPRTQRRHDIRRTVDELQAVRREAGLPPLWIATDQEGGPVAKLSPPLATQPALKTLLEDLDGPDLANQPARAGEIIRRVTAYADAQGRELAEAGINLNFAPVVDLHPANPPDALDFHSRIATRALAADPATVALAGETYCPHSRQARRHLRSQTFPRPRQGACGHPSFRSDLGHSLTSSNRTDWLPFREISRNTGTGMMLGHVRVGHLIPIIRFHVRATPFGCCGKIGVSAVC